MHEKNKTEIGILVDQGKEIHEEPGFHFRMKIHIGGENYPKIFKKLNLYFCFLFELIPPEI